MVVNNNRKQRTQYASSTSYKLAQLLREHVAGLTGYLFSTRKGNPLPQRATLRALHVYVQRAGFIHFGGTAQQFFESTGYPKT